MNGKLIIFNVITANTSRDRSEPEVEDLETKRTKLMRHLTCRDF